MTKRTKAANMSPAPSSIGDEGGAVGLHISEEALVQVLDSIHDNFESVTDAIKGGFESTADAIKGGFESINRSIQQVALLIFIGYVYTVSLAFLGFLLVVAKYDSSGYQFGVLLIGALAPAALIWVFPRVYFVEQAVKDAPIQPAQSRRQRRRRAK